MWEIALYIVSALAGAWIICGYLAFGYNYSHCNKILGTRSKVLIQYVFLESLRTAALGPIGLVRLHRMKRTNLGRLYPWQSTRWKL